jgi:tetratricopeptide (TPR) repeat protein
MLSAIPRINKLFKKLSNKTIAEINVDIAQKKHRELLKELSSHKITPANSLLLGNIYQELGDKEKALDAWTKAYHLNKNDREIQFSLLCSLYENRQVDSKIYDRLTEELIIDESRITLHGSHPAKDQVDKLLQNYGVALLRDYYPREIAERRDAYMHENMQRVRDILVRHGIDPLVTTLPSWFMCPHQGDDSLEKRTDDAFASKSVTKNDFCSEKDQQDLVQFMNDLLSLGLREPINDYLKRTDYTFHQDRSANRYYGGGTVNDYFGAHQDTRLAKGYFDFINFWIPFAQCGTVAPSLGFVPVKLINNFATDNIDALDIQRDCFPPGVFQKPDYNPGDVLVMTSFTLHASFSKFGMPKTRTSADLRLL